MVQSNNYYDVYGDGPTAFGSMYIPGYYFGSARLTQEYDVYEMWTHYYTNGDQNRPIDSKFNGYRYSPSRRTFSMDVEFVGPTRIGLNELTDKTVSLKRTLIPEEGIRYDRLHGNDFDIVREFQVTHTDFGYVKTARVVIIWYGEGTSHTIQRYGYQTKSYYEYGTVKQWEESPYVNTVLGPKIYANWDV